jgi:hypothetical protein
VQLALRHRAISGRRNRTTVNSHGHSDILAIYRTSVSEISCLRFRVFDHALDVKQAALMPDARLVRPVKDSCLFFGPEHIDLRNEVG